MDITTLAAWGEFIGGIGVIASLIYLASQIRQNSKLLRASTGSARTQNAVHFTTLLVQDPELQRIYLEGLANPEALSQADRQRFDAAARIVFLGYHQQYESFREGLVGAGVWEQLRLSMSWMLQRSGTQQWWRDWYLQFPHEFREFVDGLIREGEPAE